MTKAEIRNQISALRPDFQCLEKMSAAVVEKFQTLELFQQAKAIGAYMPLPDEVDIAPFFQGLEHQLYIPAFDETIGSYRMAKYTPELKAGKFGILEPVDPVFAEQGEIDLIIVPGIAFDQTGRRIGRGGGFYDRLLPQYNAVRAGICFDFQCLPVLSDEGVEVEELPVEPHDCVMDLLITESRILKFALNS
ncbi:MAG: 5-formyltetrahydrofolate cyclo-ligase [Kiritimatiellales bacterium]|nr:5-formyltetrahydrofolate cyclo-ligase [Kiritimatiellota bacterium]MBL7011347.1 5-formyltetrahydrofolate cyclo-ligase [Kiritimatiellales bacterium]